MDKTIKHLKEAWKILETKEDLLSRLEDFIPNFIEIAQKVYDNWDEEDVDTYAGGGICHIIAGEIADFLSDNKIDATTYSLDYKQHVVAVAYDQEEEDAFIIDIPEYLYEKGGGISWNKIPEVEFDETDVDITRMNYDQFLSIMNEGQCKKATLKRLESSHLESNLGVAMPVGLIDELQMSMEETWANSVVDFVSGKGGKYIVNVKRDKLDEFLQGVLYSLDNMIEGYEKADRARGKRWMNTMHGVIRKIKEENPDLRLPMTFRFLKMI